jgi:hypothetical protein
LDLDRGEQKKSDLEDLDALFFALNIILKKISCWRSYSTRIKFDLYTNLKKNINFLEDLSRSEVSLVSQETSPYIYSTPNSATVSPRAIRMICTSAISTKMNLSLF